jgi:uncharacterized protein DUF1573
MARKAFVFWITLALLLALPQLAVAQYYWEVLDTGSSPPNQVVYPNGTVSVFEDITYPTVAQRRYEIRNTASFRQDISSCSIIGDNSFVISVYPYTSSLEEDEKGEEDETLEEKGGTVYPGQRAPLGVQHLAYTTGTQTATVQCSTTTGYIIFQVRGRVLDANPYIVLETPTGTNIPKNSTFNFGSTQAGTPIDKDFRIVNLGNQALTVSLSLTGSAYSVVTAPPPSIAKGSEATFRLRLLSATAGTFTDQLRITNNDPNDNPYTVNLTGTVTAIPAPQIRVTYNGSPVAKGSTVNLGSTTPNTPLDRTFFIENIGTATLTISNNTNFLSGTGYSMIGSSPAGSLSPGSNTIFTVRFQAAALGSYPGMVSLQNNSGVNPFDFNLQATVAPAPVPRIRIVAESAGGQTIVPGSTTISFGSTTPNTPVTQIFRIYNDGTGTLTLSNPTVQGNGFAFSNLPPSSIAAGGSATFSIRFQAANGGTYNGSVSLSHNDTTVANPLSFNLQATVNPPLPVVTLAVSDSEASETSPNGGSFTLTRTGSTASALTVTLSRSGTAVDGSDYTSIATSQTFAVGQSSLSLAVSPINDTAIEDVETVTLSLVPGAGYNVGSPSSGTVSITNNDFNPCTPAAALLCLQGGRFEATLTGTVGSTSYTGQAFVLGDNSGGFWLFSPDNVEVAVKVLDGAPVNGRFWTFHGAATDVAYTLTVKDRANASQVRTYSKPAGTFCGGADTGSFIKSGPRRPRTAPRSGAVRETYVKSFTCVPNATTTCLLGNRFQVRVKRGTAYQQVVPVTSQTSFFWFYSPDNTEIFVKLLDGTFVNGKYWVFFGSMTDQAYNIEVTDTVTGILKSYASPGPICGGADTSAF